MVKLISNLIKSYQTLSNLIKSYQTLSNLIKSYQILSNLIKSYQILSNLIKSYQILTNLIKSWNLIKSSNCQAQVPIPIPKSLLSPTNSKRTGADTKILWATHHHPPHPITFEHDGRVPHKKLKSKKGSE